MIPAVRPKPCDQCPFRAQYKGEVDYLRAGRREDIVLQLLSGEAAQFECHKSLKRDDDGEVIQDGQSQECAGALLTMLRADHDTQHSRIVHRLGMFDPDEFIERNADVDLWTFEELTEAPDEFEPCNTVGDNCLAPAGYSTGGGIVSGTISADGKCEQCGEPCCSECLEEYEGQDFCGSCFWYESKADG